MPLDVGVDGPSLHIYALINIPDFIHTHFTPVYCLVLAVRFRYPLARILEDPDFDPFGMWDFSDSDLFEKRF